MSVSYLQSKEPFLPPQYWDSHGRRQFHASVAGVCDVSLCCFVSWKPFLGILFKNIYPETGIYTDVWINKPIACLIVDYYRYI